jgi:hypothetical protein
METTTSQIVTFYSLDNLVDGRLLGRRKNDLGELAYLVERSGFTCSVRPCDIYRITDRLISNA